MKADAIEAMREHLAALEQEVIAMRAEGYEMGPEERVLAEARAMLAEETEYAARRGARRERGAA